MNHLQKYLSDVGEIHSSGSGTKETSFYPSLSNLFNDIGASLKPKVRCIIHVKNSGAGVPDGGFFTAEQTRKADQEAPLLGLKPARGVIEVKSPIEKIPDIIKTAQVKKYLAEYGQLLVTNLRSFVLLTHNPSGAPHELESFELAADDKSFWNLAAKPGASAPEVGQRFEEYIKRVMLHAAPLNNPKDVAFFLASYARDARARVESAADLQALKNIRNALEEALGMKFENEKGEHFFRSTLVQTLFYGVFSAWVLWHKESPNRADQFDWKSAAWTLHVPMIKALFEQVATPTRLGPLGLVEPLNWTAAALNRVNRAEFFKNFVESHAVQYFYEPFLEAFDPDLRKQLGVWYTPPEIVEYMVARVDTVLREELDIPDGLADKRVFVLDPCCGTGAYLVEVLKKIEHTHRVEKGEGALAELAVKDAAQQRVFGFEIMPAPFVVAHLQLGLILQNLSVPLDDSKQERVGVFLTNALTGWDFVGENPILANWPELEAERKGAGKVKQERPILVVLGNPPYNAYAGVSPEEEQGLVEPYKDGLVKNWGIKKFNLDDLYVRFFRLAERRIAEKTGKGIVCFISNFSYLSDPSFVVMRQRFLSEFDSLWFDCLNGDSRETGKLTPEGKPDPSVFSTDFNREGIRVGTSVGLMVRSEKRRTSPRVLYREFWGVTKRQDILATLKSKRINASYEQAHPNDQNRFSFHPLAVEAEYLAWPKLTEICANPPLQGMDEDRANSLIEMQSATLTERIEQYFDPKISWSDFKLLKTGLSRKSAAFEPESVRKAAQQAETFSADQIKKYVFRPCDVRWCYYTGVPNVWKRSRPELWKQLWPGNSFVLSRSAGVAEPEGVPFLFTSDLFARDCLRGHAVAFPLRIREVPKEPPKKKDENGEFGILLQEAKSEYDAIPPKITANLSKEARQYLASIGVKDPDKTADDAALLWMHAMAIGYSPLYLTENSDGVRQDWPRIPLPKTKAGLAKSAELGKRIQSILESPRESSAKDKTDGGAKVIAVLSSAADLRLTVGWGHEGKEGVTMPGKGKAIQRAFAPNEANPLLGNHTYDVYLNETTRWKNIPEKVWEFTIGGYQVIKKWLSYREFELLGRSLTSDEAREFTNLARRIATLILLQPELDKNYLTIKANAVSLPK